MLTVLAGLAPVGPLAPEPAEAAGLGLRWQRSFPGNRIHLSSPTIADVTGDGQDDIVIGGLDGWVRVLRGDGTPIWERQVVVPHSSTPTAVEASPTVADLDGDGSMEVIVGAVSRWVPNQQGGLVVFDRNGNVRWRWTTYDIFNMWNEAWGPYPDGYREGVASTPAVGDVDGDGKMDIVFGAFDNRVHALDRNGNNVPGFPVHVDDSVWSSPALADVDGDGRQEVFVGIAATPGGPIDHRGGFLMMFDWANGAVHNRWNKALGEVVDGSPAIADINADGALDVVVTTSTNYNHADGRKVWAWRASDGAGLPGWPVQSSGQVVGSPAIGDIGEDGRPEVVVGTRAGWVHAYRSNGTEMWARVPNQAGEGGGEIVGHAVIADLDGNGSQDVAIGNGWGTFAMRGSDGARLFDPIGIGWSYQNAPAVGNFGPYGRQIVIAGFRNYNGEYNGGDGHMFGYQLAGSSTTPHWPMARKNARHLGAAPSDGPALPAWQCQRSTNPPARPSQSSARGYWVLARDGSVYTHGAGMQYFGNLRDRGVSTPAAAIAARRDGGGYWIVDDRGLVHAFGSAPFKGDMRGRHVNGRIVALEPTPSGNGYWLLGSDGGVFSFGDARFHGSTGSMRLNAPIISMKSTTVGDGYWLLAADGGVFSFGGARFHGSTGGMRLNAPIISMAVDPGGRGYWLLGSDGGVFTFGRGLGFHGSVPGIGLCASPVSTQIRPTAAGGGYWLLGSDGGVFSFGDAAFRGAHPLTGGNRAVDMAVVYP
jgi:hypothetical protein